MADTGQGRRARQAEQMARNTSIGRYQAPENLFTQAITLGGLTGGVQDIQASRTIPLNKPLESIQVVLSGRLAVGTANYTSLYPEHFANLLQTVQLTGTHRQYGNLTPIRLSGATLFAYAKLFKSANSSEIIINNSKAIDPTLPYTTPVVNERGTTIFDGGTAGSPYDFVVIYEIPLGLIFPPSAGNANREVSFSYLPQDWTDSLQLRFILGDRTSLGVPAGGTTTTFTSFGSASGTPSLEVNLNYSILGPFANQVRGGIVIRAEQTINTMTALATMTRVSTLAKQATSNILLKSGLLAAGTTAGVAVYGSLSDAMLARTQLQVDNKPIKNNTNNMLQKNYIGRMFNSGILPTGHFVFSFVEGSQSPLTLYRGDGLAPAADFAVYSDIATAAATNYITLVQEQIFGGPLPSLK